MTPQLNQTQWLELPVPVRDKLRAIFKIPRSGPTQTILGSFGKAQSDGSTDKDVSVLSVEAMQAYLGNYGTDDFFALFTQVLTRLDSEQELPKIVEEATPIYDQWKADLLRMRDESEKENLVLKLKHLAWEIFPQPVKTNAPIQERPVKGTKKRK